MVSNDSEQSVSEQAVRPVIGLPTYLEYARFGSWDTECAVLPHPYVHMVEQAGGIPVLLPPGGVARPELVARLDGLVLTGGADVDPGRYHATPDPSLGAVRPDRDESEFTLFALARAVELPMLAVCRGLQVVNVALGGTLVQHLPDVVGHEEHSGGANCFTVTHVHTTPGSRVAGIVGPEVKANCHHHQAIGELAGELVVTARAADDTIEAAETRGGPFLVGVQWHPEADASDIRLMRALVEAAAAYRDERRSGNR
ncbi:gamma-glutamyl-gamma-aminobutyrate hydrolase family protein [Nocardia sp. NPDC052566]|uniref:gamma-glutamyl-gamma-aminobutyrate hydrolase family protein n=1 Tax=Nocardia sp. NPDC052566 TaxID=3364330 RepID=UPI0037C50F91